MSGEWMCSVLSKRNRNVRLGIVDDNGKVCVQRMKRKLEDVSVNQKLRMFKMKQLSIY